MAEAVLEAVGLRKSFGGVKALDGVDIRLAKGEVVAVVGPNGSGKTTLINALSGFVELDGGRIYLEGRDITKLPPHKRVKLGLARSFQLPSLFWGLTVRRNVEIALASMGADGDVKGLLDDFGLWNKRDLKVEELSEGEKKLLDVALTFAASPKVVMLDEPTSSVGEEDKHEVMSVVMENVRRRGASAIFVEHDVNIVEEYADRVVVMMQGRAVAILRPEEARALAL